MADNSAEAWNCGGKGWNVVHVVYRSLELTSHFESDPRTDEKLAFGSNHLAFWPQCTQSARTRKLQRLDCGIPRG